MKGIITYQIIQWFTVTVYECLFSKVFCGYWQGILGQPQKEILHSIFKPIEPEPKYKMIYGAWRMMPNSVTHYDISLASQIRKYSIHS